MRTIIVVGAAWAVLCLGGPLPSEAQEITYSISPGGKVAAGEVPYAKLARTPNEIYSPNPLQFYRTPEATYYSYPTFDIREVEKRDYIPRRPRRQEDWLR